MHVMWGGIVREKLPIEVVDVPEMARSPLGHPQAVTVGDYVLLAGQMATDYETGVVPHLGQTLPDAPYWHVRMEHQAEHVIASTRTLLEAAGSSLDRCVKVTSFHTDLRELPSSMAVRT